MKKQLFIHTKPIYVFWVAFCHIPLEAWPWGFLAHKQINRYAITTLPPAMFAFYKVHLTFLTEQSVHPDKRRYVVKGEASKHFIDVEHYQDSLLDVQKLLFKQAVAKYGAKTIETHGQLPWAILHVHKQLTEAFKHKDIAKILKLSADLGHYIADAHVPLHTTQNYNGQMTGQEGIHALWETRLPALFVEQYNFFVGQATYIQDLSSYTWHIVLQSHALVEGILDLEKQLSAQYPAVAKYSFEQDGPVLKKEYSVAFATMYHQALQGQVESRMQQSIKAIGNYWLTAWINAGSPTLNDCNKDLPIQEAEDALLQESTILEGIRVCGAA